MKLCVPGYDPTFVTQKKLELNKKLIEKRKLDHQKKLQIIEEKKHGIYRTDDKTLQKLHQVS